MVSSDPPPPSPPSSIPWSFTGSSGRLRVRKRPSNLIRAAWTSPSFSPGLSPPATKPESGRGDAHRLAPTEVKALKVSQEAVEHWLPQVQAWLVLKPVHESLDAPTAEAEETHKKSNRQSTLRCAGNKSRRAGRKKRRRKSALRKRKRPRLGPRQKLSCRERSQPARRRGRRSAKKRKRHRRKETRKGAKNDKRKKRATTRRRAGKSGELETHDASPTQTRGPPGPGRGSRKRPKKESPELGPRGRKTGSYIIIRYSRWYTLYTDIHTYH